MTRNGHHLHIARTPVQSLAYNIYSEIALCSTSAFHVNEQRAASISLDTFVRTRSPLRANYRGWHFYYDSESCDFIQFRSVCNCFMRRERLFTRLCHPNTLLHWSSAHHTLGRSRWGRKCVIEAQVLWIICCLVKSSEFGSLCGSVGGERLRAQQDRSQIETIFMAFATSNRKNDLRTSFIFMVMIIVIVQSPAGYDSASLPLSLSLCSSRHFYPFLSIRKDEAHSHAEFFHFFSPSMHTK